MIHGTSSTPDCYFHQLMVLGNKGYRVISVGSPAVNTHMDWVICFRKFLELLDISKVHLFGASLGGFLALHYVAMHPSDVLSVVLSNSFCDTELYAENSPCLPT